jgi:filamentous hemagglutinin
MKHQAAQDAANAVAKAGDTAAAAQYQAEADSWAEGGSNRVARHAIGGAMVAGLGGGNALSGALGTGAAAALAGNLNSITNAAGQSGDVSQLAGNIAANILAGGVGALVGGSSGAFTASNVDLYNRDNDCGKGCLQGDVDGFRIAVMGPLAGPSPSFAQIARY